MTVQLVVSGVLLLVAVAAVWMLAVLVTLQRQIVHRQVTIDKHQKAAIRDVRRTQQTADRILDRTYKFQKQVDVLLMDPKVQAALNRYEDSNG